MGDCISIISAPYETIQEPDNAGRSMLELMVLVERENWKRPTKRSETLHNGRHEVTFSLCPEFRASSTAEDNFRATLGAGFYLLRLLNEKTQMWHVIPKSDQ